MWFFLRGAIFQSVGGDGARCWHSSSCSNKFVARSTIWWSTCMASYVRLCLRSSAARECASGLIGRSNFHTQFPPSTISRTFRTTAGAAPAKVPGSRTRTAFPFRRSTSTRSIVTCGSDACLVLMIDRWTSQSICHRKQSATCSDCLRSTACLVANRSLSLCPAQFGKRNTGLSMGLPALRASFFAKDLLSLSRVRNAMRRVAGKSQLPRREPAIFAAKPPRQIWRG